MLDYAMQVSYKLSPRKEAPAVVVVHTIFELAEAIHAAIAASPMGEAVVRMVTTVEVGGGK